MTHKANLPILSSRKTSSYHVTGFKDEAILLDYRVAMRYRRQLHEIDTPVLVKERYDESDMISGIAYSLALGKPVNLSIYELDKLQPDNVFVGPAIIESPITTILIDTGYQGAMDEYMNITIRRKETS